MRTRIFKIGSFQAVRIPEELASGADVRDVEIERVGNALVVRPRVDRTLADLDDLLAEFSPHFMAGGREFHEERDRES